MSTAGAEFPNHQLFCSRLLTSGQWDRALEAAQEWLAQDPQNPRAHMTAGQALINLQCHVEAEKHMRWVLAAEPQNATAHRFMSVILFAEEHYRAADKSIQKAIELNPRDYHNWNHLALMCYRKRDMPATQKYASKARELNPRDPESINLLALSDSLHRQERFHQALELDPQNASVHNNLGLHYLNHDKDFEKAEECFRRALFFKPTLAVARTNLFNTLKRRDRIYRWSCAPRDFLLKGFAFMGHHRRNNLLVFILLLPLWFLAFRYVFGALILWFLLVWPMVKAYEILTVGDIRAEAGEIGARRGGFLGYRRWPQRVRLGIFAGLLIAFWGGIIFFVHRAADGGAFYLAEGIFGLLLVILVWWLFAFQLKWFLRAAKMRYDAWRRGRQFDKF